MFNHLPTPLEGTEYRTRRVRERDANNKLLSPMGEYNTTGLFPVGAPDGTINHLEAAPVLFLDCDLAALDGFSKAVLHSMPDEELEAHLDSLEAYVRALLPYPPNAVVSSGYGLHFYFWLEEGSWHRLPEIRQMQQDLLALVNSRAGMDVADKNVCDSGTRILRTPGTLNRKGLPRNVRVRHLDVELRVPVAVSAPPVPLARPAPTRDAGPARGLSFEEDVDQIRHQLNVLFEQCPFFLWCQEHATEVKARSWYGAATNIAAIAAEHGRDAFHQLSACDPARYDAADTDKVYSQALERIAAGEGPWTYETLAQNGDWKGAKSKYKAPAVMAHQFKPLPPTDEPLALDKEGRPKSIYPNLRKLLRVEAHRYRWNQMSRTVDFDGEAITDAFYGDLRERLFDAYGVTFDARDARSAVYETAMRTQYHPVREYLRGLPAHTGRSQIPALLRALGVDDTDLHRRYLECFLIGAVRRALNEDPQGVKMDTLLVLQGNQGFGKSTFFRVLGSPWFSDTPIVPGTKDAMQSAALHWIIEWPEMDRLRDAAVVKAFISSPRDDYRPPFATEPVSVTRHCVFVGTTNEDGFLTDDTGSRRYHVMHISQAIDTDLVQNIREAVWAEAVALAEAGRPHWLSAGEDEQRAVSNEGAQAAERWSGVIDEFLDSAPGRKLDEITIEYILGNVLDIPMAHWQRADMQEVGRILKRADFTRHRVQVDGKRGYVYRRPQKALALVK